MHRIVERYYRLKRNNHPRGGDTLAESRRKKETMMQTDDAHLPRERSFNGKAIDIKGCISTEGRRMWENLRQRPVDLLLRTRTPQFFPRTRRYTRLKNAYYPRSSRIAAEKIFGAGYGIYRGILLLIRRWVWIIGCRNKIVSREEEGERAL